MIEMNSWLIIILVFLLITSIGILLLFYWDIKNMTNQLEQIIGHFGTNELVRTNTHSKIMIRFITKINQLIQLFKQDQQQRQKREQTLKQEITNISHDLRTPLTSIKGFAELLSDSTLSDLEKQEYLTIIKKKIDSLTMMVDLFYELSQLDSLDDQLHLEEQCLNQIVIEAMLMFYDEFNKKQLTIQFKEAPVSSIEADQKATKRIVYNIIQNALRYAKSHLTIDLIEEDQYIQLSARNDSEQIDQIDPDRIFDRTYRFDRSRTDGQVGLGLHIVQQLVNKQGGKIEAKIDEGTFQIDIRFKKWS